MEGHAGGSGAKARATYQVFSEAIVVPESVDAVRALLRRVKEGGASIPLTDTALGMWRDFLAAAAVATRASSRSR